MDWSLDLFLDPSLLDTPFDARSSCERTTPNADSRFACVDVALAYLVLTAVVEKSLKNVFTAASPNMPIPQLLRLVIYFI